MIGALTIVEIMSSLSSQCDRSVTAAIVSSRSICGSPRGASFHREGGNRDDSIAVALV
jgi:hypothetical protein